MDAVSRISKAYPDRVEVRGRDLTGDLMGRLTFTDYFHLLLTGEEPTEEQRYFLDLLLVAIAEHGMMPTNVAARMTLAADPGSLQGAVAAGILGAGPVVLGTSEECARLLTSGREPREIAQEIHAAGGKVPGFGHPVHKPLDPRAAAGRLLDQRRGHRAELGDEQPGAGVRRAEGFSEGFRSGSAGGAGRAHRENTAAARRPHPPMSVGQVPQRQATETLGKPQPLAHVAVRQPSCAPARERLPSR